MIFSSRLIVLLSFLCTSSRNKTVMTQDNRTFIHMDFLYNRNYSYAEYSTSHSVNSYFPLLFQQESTGFIFTFTPFPSGFFDNILN
jgi:hypothetical protein